VSLPTTAVALRGHRFPKLYDARLPHFGRTGSGLHVNTTSACRGFLDVSFRVRSFPFHTLHLDVGPWVSEAPDRSARRKRHRGREAEDSQGGGQGLTVMVSPWFRALSSGSCLVTRYVDGRCWPSRLDALPAQYGTPLTLSDRPPSYAANETVAGYAPPTLPLPGISPERTIRPFPALLRTSEHRPPGSSRKLLFRLAPGDVDGDEDEPQALWAPVAGDWSSPGGNSPGRRAPWRPNVDDTAARSLHLARIAPASAGLGTAPDRRNGCRGGSTRAQGSEFIREDDSGRQSANGRVRRRARTIPESHSRGGPG